MRVNLNHVPENNHQKNSGAGFTDFSVDFTRDEEGLPQAANQTRAAKDNRLIPVYLKRPAGRFRLWATDYQEFLQNGHRAEDLTVRIIYKQYVSAGYDVSMQEPNAFIETRVMETTPGRVAADGTMLLAYDYVLTSDTQGRPCAGGHCHLRPGGRYGTEPLPERGHPAAAQPGDRGAGAFPHTGGWLRH